MNRPPPVTGHRPPGVSPPQPRTPRFGLADAFVRVLAYAPGTVFALLAVFTFRCEHRDVVAQRARLAARTAETTGTLVEVHRAVAAKSGHDYLAGSVAFTAANGETVSVYINWLAPGTEPGKTMTVYYDPDHPAENNALGTLVPGTRDLAAATLPPAILGLVFLVTAHLQVRKLPRLGRR